MTSQPRIPPEVRCAADYEMLARARLPGPVFEYLAGGAGDDLTAAANRAAFERLTILPRLLRDVSRGHTRLRLMGHELEHPLLLAPVAFQTLAHPAGELDTARAAAATDTCLVCSTLSSFTLEEIARHAGPCRWFQLYFQPRREATLDLARRAEAAGYGALVLTLDASIQMPSLRALRAGFRMPEALHPANLAGYAAAAPHVAPPGASRVFQAAMHGAPTWADIEWLASHTALPLVVKGALRGDDARELQGRGVAALVVSNHGGRTIDGVPASLAVLPAIRAAVGPGFPLLFDGGIRSGSDAFKAIALGADAVMVGRLQIYALAVAGALGVAHMLRMLREELEVCMAATGCPTLADVGPGLLHRPQEPHPC